MSAVLSTLQPAVDLAAVKGKQQAAWSAGDYAVVGTTLQIVGESLCEALDLHPGARVLDVAAGNGNATLAAARRWADVTSTDYVPALLERGRARASADGLPVKFEQADAENLPYADCSFDVVMSTFGVMFTPDQDKSAAEMARVCKSGGRIGLANWTPTSFVGELFKTIPKYITPAAGVKSPALWGTEARLREGLSYVLRPVAQGVRGTGRRQAGCARRRCDRAGREIQSRDRRHAGRTERVYRSRHQAEVSGNFYKPLKECNNMNTTLYQRLGGAAGIAKLVDDVMAAHLANPLVKNRFENIQDLDRAKKMAREFFCAGSGGPETYTGKDMLAAHKGMNISEQEYLSAMDDIVGAMGKNGLGDDVKNDVIAILYSLKGNIIRV